MEGNKNDDEQFWSHSYLSPVRYSWVGLAFERVCMQHISQIKHKLGISGVLTNVLSWSTKALHLTMITVNGLAHNAYWGMIQSEVVLDDLFHE